jgi:hypothetical protein
MATISSANASSAIGADSLLRMLAQIIKVSNNG